MTIRLFVVLIISFYYSTTFSNDLSDLKRLQKAYPHRIKDVSSTQITWNDGTKMPVYDGLSHKNQQQKLDNPALIDQVAGVHYQQGIPTNSLMVQAKDDPGRIRYEPFFRKMYGDSEAAVRKNLVTIQWMPHVFGDNYPILVTTVNHVNNMFQELSNDLEDLVAKHPAYASFLKNPGGTFKWRVIANTKRLSTHSFGMTIDINTDKSNYWQWQLVHDKRPISENIPLVYHNQIPYEIVSIFEKHGFIWGGKWHHYDTMHFEYRPELLV